MINVYNFVKDIQFKIDFPKYLQVADKVNKETLEDFHKHISEMNGKYGNTQYDIEDMPSDYPFNSIQEYKDDRGLNIVEFRIKGHGLWTRGGYLYVSNDQLNTSLDILQHRGIKKIKPNWYSYCIYFEPR